MTNIVRDWFRATERCNLNQLNRLKDQVNVEVSTSWNMNNEEHRNVTALTLSAYIGRKEVVKWFIDLGCRVNVATHLGWTPLHFAASQGFVSTVDMLCQAGAKIDAKTNRAETAIQLALRGNMRDTVRKLLNRGASIDNLEHTKMGGRGGRGLGAAGGREMHALSRSRGGGAHSRTGGVGMNGPGRGGHHHGHSSHSHPGHHHGHHHGGHYGGQSGGRDGPGGGGGGSGPGPGGGGGGGGGGVNSGASTGGGGGSGAGESAEVARKRRELFRQMGDESRLGKAVRQLMRDPAARHNVASVKQALIDHLAEPMHQMQARHWKRQSEMLVDSLETLICEQQTPESRSNRRLLCDSVFLIVDQWSDTMYGDYLLRLVDSATQGRSAGLRCAMLDLVRQFLDREYQRRQTLVENAAQQHEISSATAGSSSGQRTTDDSAETPAENSDGNRSGLQRSPDRGDALTVVSFDLLEQVLRLLNTDDSALVIAASCRVLLAYARLFRVSFLEEEHFFTLVDHVVGWCVDPKTRDADADMLCRCVAECRPLWRARPQFAKEMTANLLEDVETNVPPLPTLSDSSSAAAGLSSAGKVRAALEKERAGLEESLIRISRYLRVACAICRGLNLQADDCTSSVRRHFDHDALFKMCNQIVKLVSPILRHLSVFLQSTANSCPSSQAALAVVMLSNSPALFAGANWLLSDLVVSLITSKGQADKCQSLYTSIVIFLANQMILAAQANSSAAYQSQAQASIIQHQTDYQLSVISLTEVLVEKSRLGLNLEWIVLYRLLGPLSPIHNYKLTSNSRVQRRLLALFTRFAHLDSLQLVDVFYQILLSDLEVCLQTLIQACDSSFKVALVRENGFQERRYSPEEALSLAIFNLGVISEIGVSRLAGLWSLTPTLFDLFVKYAPVRDVELMRAYPALHVAMVSALLAHCRAQRWLVDCSRLNADAALEAAEFPRRDGYLDELLGLVSELLSTRPSPPLALCDLLLDAVEGIVGHAAERMLWSVLESAPVADTVAALLAFVAGKVRAGAGSNVWRVGATSLGQVKRACGLAERFLGLCSPGRLAELRSLLRTAADLALALLPLGAGVTAPLLGVVARLPPDLFAKTQQEGARMKGAAEERTLLHRQWRVGRHGSTGALALRLPVWTGDRFRAEHCQILLAAILAQRAPPHAPPDWPCRLFSALSLAEGGAATGEGHERLLVPRGLQWSALIWDTVRYFLEHKLKVGPWSRPTDAFLEIEQLLQRLAAEAARGRGRTAHSGWSVCLLLLFMEWLERALYHAYEGAATVLLQPPLTPPIRHFFRTNRRTCLTWLTRNRLPLMQIAAAAGLHPLVVRHGLTLLQEAEGGHEEALRLTARSLRALGRFEVLRGLCASVAGPRTQALLEGMAEASAGRLERAQTVLEAQLERWAAGNGMTNGPDSGEPPPGGGDVRRGDVVLLLSKQTPTTSPSATPRPEAACRHVLDELMHCYSQLQDLRGLRGLRERLHRWATGSGSSPLCAAAADALHARPDTWRYWQCVTKLQVWEEERPRAGHAPWAVDEVLGAQERSLYAALSAAGGSRSQRLRRAAEGIVGECTAVVGAHALHWPCAVPPGVYAAVRAAQLVGGEERPAVGGGENSAIAGVLALRQLHLRRLCTHFDATCQPDGDGLSPRLDAAVAAALPLLRWCRRFDNVNAAARILAHSLGPDSGQAGGPASQIRALLPAVPALGLVSPGLASRLQQEMCKLLRAAGERREAWLGLCEAMTGALRRLGESDGDPDPGLGLHAESALTLVRWLRADGADHIDPSPELDRSLNFLSALSQVKWVDGCVPAVPDEAGEADRCTENVIGRLSVLASKLSPMMAKAWFAVGDWSFERSRADLKALARKQFRVELTEAERTQLLNLLPRGHTDEEAEQAANILASLPINTAAGAAGETDVRQRLQEEVFCLQVAPVELLDAAVAIWRGVLDRVYGLSVSAANGYFTFLRLSTGGEAEERDQERRMTAALRLLKLLANHIHELGHLLGEGFAATPTEPWLSIIPQVFARLNHPSPAVRDCLTGLVCRLGKDAPHRIVYPAVVGAACASSKTNPERDGAPVGDGMAREGLARDSPEAGLPEGEEEELGHGLPADMDEVVKEVSEMENEGKGAEDAQDDPLLLNTFTSLMEAMTRDNPVLVREVATFVEEMRRITVLWDELWLGTLSQHAEEVQKKMMVQLQSEIKRVQDHEHLNEVTKSRLIQVIHDTYMKPIVVSLEKIRFITSTAAETPHEEWFQEQFDATIADVITRLKGPVEPNHPEAAAQALKSLHQTLHQKSQARRRLIGQGQLDLAQISPRLAAIDASVIPMPGEVKGGVCIREIQNAFFILPTKTKPKKLIFVGDNGQRYPYLFKGLEDLHLDERIMQFLGTVNAMFARLHRPPHSATPRFFARHYAVTPLGPRSALIQMVQGATPLFPLYKKWQQREAMAMAQKQQRTAGPQAAAAAPPPAAVLAPSELFFSKLKPALEAKGLGGEDGKIAESRKEWPMSVLRGVLVELMRETPSDLLSQELWLSSLSSVDWWQSAQNYARSVAVMSVIGYVIGLGDRHLDNVMVDLANGDIVHIDYNVCFEKGRNLKVPETVPFRLTAVLRHALGPSGVEGMFRLSCEHVLRTLRERQDVLLTLLDAFLYDPLIDWTPGSETGYAGAHYGGRSEAAKGKFPSRRALEKEITQQFLGIRAVEMDPALRLWQTDFLRVLEKVRGPSENLLQLGSDLGTDGRKLQLYREMQDYVSAGAEPLASLHRRYSRYCEREERRQRVAKALEEKGAEVGRWCDRHEEALGLLRSDLLHALMAKLGRKPAPSLAAYHEPVAAFLESAGQAALAEAAGAALEKLSGLLVNRQTCLSDCLNVINVYRSHTELCRADALQDRYAVLRRLLANNDCRAALAAYSERFLGERTTSQAVAGMEDRLRGRVSELSRRLAATLAERRQVPAPGSGSEDNVDFIYSSLFQTLPVDGGATFKVAIADALHSMCRDWIDLDERLMKGGGNVGEALNLDNDESASWFLYEESCFSLMLNQLAVFMANVRIDVIAPLVSEPNQICPRQVSEAFKLVRLLDDLSTMLRKLHTNFCNILLPEAVRILTGLGLEAAGSPMELVLGLSEVSAELIPLLEARMRAGEEEEAPAGPEMEELSLRVRRVRKQWFDLLEALEKEKAEGGGLAQSQLLILAFYNEFNQMEQAFSPLVLAFRVFFMPQDWYYVDLLTSAYNCLQPVWYGPGSDTLFLDLLFLKGLRVMGEVFRMCGRFSAAFHEPRPASGEEGEEEVDSESPEMVRALVNHYLNFVWGGVLCGVGPSLAAFLMCALLEDARLSLSVVAAEQTRCFSGMTAPAHSLLQMAVEYRANEHTSLTMATQVPPPWHDFSYLHSHVSSLVGSMNNVLERQHTQLVMDTCVKMVEGRLQRAQRALASFQWLHADELGREEDLATPTRASILKELSRNATQLTGHNESIEEVEAEMKRQHDSIVQRLKWAQGANPSVGALLDQVEEAIRKNGTLLTEERTNARTVLSTVRSVLHLEAFRTRSSEAAESDAATVQFLADCADELAAAGVEQAEVTDLEKELMRVQPGLEGGDWQERLSAELNVRCADLVASLKERQREARDRVKDLVGTDQALRTTVSRHTRLLSTFDIRTVLKAMARFDDPRVKAYAREYRRFSSELSALLRLLAELEKESSDTAIVNTATQVAAHRARLVGLVEPLRRHLRALAPKLAIDGEEEEEGVEGEEDDDKATDGPADTKPKSGAGAGHALVQARNPYALTVWRRVQGKLTGRDGPALRGRDPFTVEEQVDWIIKEATNLDNLALMYEGWTAWL